MRTCPKLQFRPPCRTRRGEYGCARFISCAHGCGRRYIGWACGLIICCESSGGEAGTSAAAGKKHESMCLISRNVVVNMDGARIENCKLGCLKTARIGAVLWHGLLLGLTTLIHFIDNNFRVMRGAALGNVLSMHTWM